MIIIKTRKLYKDTKKYLCIQQNIYYLIHLLVLLIILEGKFMSEQTIKEVSEILVFISENNSVPRNIREAASESNEILNDEEQDQSVKISTVLGKLDDISNDPNIPVQARTLIWEVLSKLESI